MNLTTQYDEPNRKRSRSYDFGSHYANGFPELFYHHCFFYFTGCRMSDTKRTGHWNDKKPIHFTSLFAHKLLIIDHVCSVPFVGLASTIYSQSRNLEEIPTAHP